MKKKAAKKKPVKSEVFLELDGKVYIVEKLNGIEIEKNELEGNIVLRCILQCLKDSLKKGLK